MEKEIKIKLEVTREELQLMTGIFMLYRLNGFNSIHESKRRIGIKLAEKLSLLDMQQYAKHPPQPIKII